MNQTAFTILVIGGSNSLMRTGYVEAMRYGLERSLKRPINVVNKAVGASFSHFGIFQLMRLDPELQVDAIVVEYALNDSELIYGGTLEEWERGHEGLLRLLRQRFPSTPMMSLLFYRRTGIHLSRVSPVAATICYLARRYHSEVFDAAELIESLARPGSLDAKDIYKDDSHYSKMFQAIIGSKVAERICESHATGSTTWQDLPPVNPKNYSDLKRLGDKLKHHAYGDFEETIFENSLLRESALVFSEGSGVRMRIDGKPVALITFSIPEDGYLRYSNGDNNSIVPFYRRALRDGKFSFLLNIVLCDQIFRHKEEEFADRIFELSLLPQSNENDVKLTGARQRPTLETPPPADGTPRRFALIDVLYVGTASSV
ncbi:SGNH/GDSL hydrolase family protein [Roseivivax marinus]|uniref:SGNH/GDSL hydrolase family protein n=1 Tax=Roseivivax marinus TaxID=1379903 RepID=UPI0004BABE77|nr:SGNH/GDSL hydrolase family protein [Roseivivax marinus]